MAEEDFNEYEVDETYIQGNLDPAGNLSHNLGEHLGVDASHFSDLPEGFDADPALQEYNGNPPPGEFVDKETNHEHDVTHTAYEADSTLDGEEVNDDNQVDLNAPENYESEEVHAVGKRWPGWPGDNVFRMLIPAQKVGSIIGRKGEFIKKIIEETKSRVKILDGPPGTMERAVMVSAKEEPDADIPPAVEGLLQVHKRLIASDSDSLAQSGGVMSTKFLVADTHAGSLIGKQGATIKVIQDTSKCTIRVLGPEHLPLFALPGDSLVEIQGEPSGVHKAVEMIATHLRKFLVDHSVISVFETQMQRPNARVNQGTPQHDHWGPPPPGSGRGSGHGFSPKLRYMQPPGSAGHFDDYYPPSDMTPLDNQPRHPGYGRDLSVGYQSSSMQPPQPTAAKVTHHMQVPLSYADAVIGASGANISYIRRASGAAIAIQETRGRPDQMTVEIQGSVAEIQIAEQLIQNFMAEATTATRNPVNESYNQSYNSYANQAPPTNPSGHIGHMAPPGGDYGSTYDRNYGY
ncbi:unnamed protein product [Rhodiola kirilowii]